MEQIIEELKSIRQKFAITMLEISKGCGVTERSVIAWLNNNSKPHAQHLVKIGAFVKRIKAKAEKEEREKFERCEAVILNEIYNGENLGLFHARPQAGTIFSHANFPLGIAQKDVSLKLLSRACAVRLNDPIVLKVLDHLSSKGQIKIVSFFVPVRRNFEHLNFKIELGQAERSVPGQDQNFKLIRSYQTRPISKEEIKASAGILNLKDQIESVYKRHEDSLRARYGASGIEAEIREHKEKIEDEARARISQLEASESLAKINKGEKKMEGDHRPISEYTEVKNYKKVREFFEEVVENNTDRISVVYDCNQEKIEIPPHSKRIVLRARMIEPMPKAKEVKIIK